MWNDMKPEWTLLEQSFCSSVSLPRTPSTTSSPTSIVTKNHWADQYNHILQSIYNYTYLQSFQLAQGFKTNASLQEELTCAISLPRKNSTMWLLVCLSLWSRHKLVTKSSSWLQADLYVCLCDRAIPVNLSREVPADHKLICMFVFVIAP